MMLAGSLLVILALLHAFIPAKLNWKTELPKLSIINRQLMQVHTMFIALTVLFMGVLTAVCRTELTGTILGKKICTGLAIFWGIRLCIQFFGYSSETWKGKKFETVIHWLSICFWTYLVLIYSISAMK